MPYKIALLDDDNNDALFLVDTLVDMLFLVDIYVNFNSPITNVEHQLDYNRRRVTVAYLKSWFMIDILASVPMNLILKFTLDTQSNVNISG